LQKGIHELLGARKKVSSGETPEGGDVKGSQTPHNWLVTIPSVVRGRGGEGDKTKA